MAKQLYHIYHSLHRLNFGVNRLTILIHIYAKNNKKSTYTLFTRQSINAFYKWYNSKGVPIRESTFNKQKKY